MNFEKIAMSEITVFVTKIDPGRDPQKIDPGVPSMVSDQIVPGIQFLWIYIFNTTHRQNFFKIDFWIFEIRISADNFFIYKCVTAFT